MLLRCYENEVKPFLINANLRVLTIINRLSTCFLQDKYDKIDHSYMICICYMYQLRILIGEKKREELTCR